MLQWESNQQPSSLKLHACAPATRRSYLLLRASINVIEFKIMIFTNYTVYTVVCGDRKTFELFLINKIERYRPKINLRQLSVYYYGDEFHISQKDMQSILTHFDAINYRLSIACSVQITGLITRVLEFRQQLLLVVIKSIY